MLWLSPLLYSPSQFNVVCVVLLPTSLFSITIKWCVCCDSLPFFILHHNTMLYVLCFSQPLYSPSQYNGVCVVTLSPSLFSITIQCCMHCASPNLFILHHNKMVCMLWLSRLLYSLSQWNVVCVVLLSTYLFPIANRCRVFCASPPLHSPSQYNVMCCVSFPSSISITIQCCVLCFSPPLYSLSQYNVVCWASLPLFILHYNTMVCVVLLSPSLFSITIQCCVLCFFLVEV